jgi:hypothetical protein
MTTRKQTIRNNAKAKLNEALGWALGLGFLSGILPAFLVELTGGW